MANHNKTPYIQEMKKGTLYVFPSAAEDIGLNLNARANTISLSHYALINIPVANTIDSTPDGQDSSSLGEENRFNLSLVPGQFKWMSGGAENNLQSYSQLLAMSLQDYAMNFETTLLNQDSYQYSDLSTVSERVFWKWLKETGAIRWESADSSSLAGFYQEETNSLYSSVVKCLGAIGSGNSLSTEFGMYNETYVNIPTSYGAGRVFFKVKDDAKSNSKKIGNYCLGRSYETQSEHLEGRDDSENSFVPAIPITDTVDSSTAQYAIYTIKDSSLNQAGHTDEAFAGTQPRLWYNLDTNHQASNLQSGISEFYMTDSALQSSDSSDFMNYFVKYDYKAGGSSSAMYMLRSRLDGVEIVKDLPTLNKIFRSQYEIQDGTFLTYDSINTDLNLGAKEEFSFNAILLYYSVYNANDQDNTASATNLFGILFLDGIQVGDGTEMTGPKIQFSIPGITKIKSTAEGFGTGYSIRVNIKTSSIYDSADSIIQDNTTSDSVAETDMNGVIGSLNAAISQLGLNTDAIREIASDYARAMSYYESANTKIKNLENKLNRYLAGERSGELSTTSLFAQEISPGKDLQDASVLKIKFADHLDEFGDVVYAEKIQISNDKTSFDLDIDVSGNLSAIDASLDSIIADKSFESLTVSSSDFDFEANRVIPFLRDELKVKRHPAEDYITEDDSGLIEIRRNTNPEYYIVPPSSQSSTYPDETDLSYLVKRDDVTREIVGFNYSKFVPLLLGYCQNLHDRIEMLENSWSSGRGSGD